MPMNGPLRVAFLYLSTTFCPGKKYLSVRAFSRVSYNFPVRESSALRISGSAQGGRTTRPYSSTLLFHASPTLRSPSFGLLERLDTVFDVDLPEGRCVCLKLRSDLSDQHQLTVDAISADDDHWIKSVLHPEEIAYGMERASDAVRQTFLLGRVAMRQALDSHDQLLGSEFAILKDNYGRPTLPAGLLGTISHKKAVAAAMVTPDPSANPAEPRFGIGVDIEQVKDSSGNIARRVLTDQEQTELGKLPGISTEEEVLLRFSIKESLYKAMHPLICQYVGFKEASVRPVADGSVVINLDLKSGDHERFAEVQAHWQQVGDLFLSSASVSLRDDAQQPVNCSIDTVHLGRNS